MHLGLCQPKAHIVQYQAKIREHQETRAQAQREAQQNRGPRGARPPGARARTGARAGAYNCDNTDDDNPDNWVHQGREAELVARARASGPARRSAKLLLAAGGALEQFAPPGPVLNAAAVPADLAGPQHALAAVASAAAAVITQVDASLPEVAAAGPSAPVAAAADAEPLGGHGSAGPDGDVNRSGVIDLCDSD